MRLPQQPQDLADQRIDHLDHPSCGLERLLELKQVNRFLVNIDAGKAVSQSLRREQDLVLGVEFDSESETSTGSLFSSWTFWANQQGVFVGTQTMLTRRLKARHDLPIAYSKHVKDGDKYVRGFKGLKLQGIEYNDN